MISASHARLDALVAEGRFRADLLARIDLWAFDLPSLRARAEDIAPNLEHELARLRTLYGNHVFGKRNILREMIGHLRANGGIGILIDQRVREDQGIPVPFFGHPARTHPVLARFVRRTGAPVVPIFGYWDGPARYTVSFGEPVDPASLSEQELEDGPLTERFMAITEAAIRHTPSQWLWYHDRWRNLRTQR